MMEKMRNVFKGEKGFTLIELLVVVAIIGILVAIAIPQFSAYKKSANDAAAKSQLATLATAMEACYVSTQDYSHANCALAGLTANYGYVAQTGVTVTFPGTHAGASAVAASTWSANAVHASGTAGGFNWDSVTGGAQW